VIGQRATGILDFLNRIGGDLVTPPQASPVDREPSPLQQAMNRPTVQVSQPSGSVMATNVRGGPLALASTTPEVQAQFNPMPQQGMPTPPPVTTVDQRPELNDEVRAQQSPLGQGQFTPEMLRMAQDASEVERQVAANPQIEQDPTFMDRVKSYFGSRENMARLALAFNSMRLEPDANLAAGLREELSGIRERQGAQGQANRTAAFFESQGETELANAIRAGMSASDAISMFREKQKGVVVGKMIVNPTTGDIIYDGSQEGSELPATFRALQERAKAAGLKPGTEAYQQFMINGGQRAGLSIKTNPDGTFEITEGGAIGSGKAMTEAQGKGLMFSQRMGASQGIINNFENEGTSIFNAIVSNVPFAGNLLTSPEYKLYEQAKRDFINAQLRFESGAAIGAAEFENADKQYFPQPGDTPEVIAQKRANRELAIQTMNAVSGPQAKEYAKNIRVMLFGPEAANWPDVGNVIDDPDNPGTKLRYRGGDPNIDSNWEVQE